MLITKSYSIYVTETDDGVRWARIRLNLVDDKDPDIRKDTDKILGELRDQGLQSFLLECERLIHAEEQAHGVA